MDNIELKVGTKIELELIDRTGQKIGQSYISQIIDILNEHDILIAVPIHESRLTFILSGTSLRIVFLHNTHGLLSFTGVIAKKEKTGNLAAFYVKSNNDFKKIQRRQYFRFDCILPVKYNIRTEDSEEHADYAELETDFKNAITRDISGCGLCIVCEDNLEKGDLIAIELSLPNDIKIHTLCKVIRSQKIDGHKDKKFQVGLYFSRISHKDQDCLIKFIFDQERQILKKTNWKKS